MKVFAFPLGDPVSCSLSVSCESYLHFSSFSDQQVGLSPQAVPGPLRTIVHLYINCLPINVKRNQAPHFPFRVYYVLHANGVLFFSNFFLAVTNFTFHSFLPSFIYSFSKPLLNTTVICIVSGNKTNTNLCPSEFTLLGEINNKQSK